MSPDAYCSRLTNVVFVEKLAWAARKAKVTDHRPFLGHRTMAGCHAYDRTVRGIPMNPEEVKKLLTVANERGKQFEDDDVLTAWMLLRELYKVARRTVPTMRDNAMRFIYQPGKFNPETPNPRITGLLHQIPPLSHTTPPRRTDAPPLETAMELDMQGWYLLLKCQPSDGSRHRLRVPSRLTNRLRICVGTGACPPTEHAKISLSFSESI